MRARICYQCVLPPPDMIVSGAPVPAEKLARAGLFDEVIEGDLHEGALRFAARVADRRPLPLVRDRRVEHPSAEGFLAAGKFADEIVPFTTVTAAADKESGRIFTKEVTLAADEGIRSPR